MDITVTAEQGTATCELTVEGNETGREVCKRALEAMGFKDVDHEDTRLFAGSEVVGMHATLDEFAEVTAFDLITGYEKKSAENKLSELSIPIEHASLQNAVRELNGSTVALLLSAGVAPYESMLNEAVQNARSPVDDPSLASLFTAVLKNKSCVRSSSWYRSVDGETPLHVCEASHVALLVGFGFDVNRVDKIKKQTPLHLAVNDLDRVKELVRKHARLNLLDWNKRMPVHHAVAAGQADVVDFLIESKALVSERDFRGQTPLHIAAGNGDLEMVKKLTPKTPRNIRDTSGMTPLHLATVGAYADVVSFLMSKGASCNIKDGMNRHPYQTAYDGKPPGKFAATIAVIEKGLPPVPVTRKIRDCLLCCSDTRGGMGVAKHMRNRIPVVNGK